MDKSEPGNLFQIGDALPGSEEFSEPLYEAGDVRIERIVSRGHRSPEGFWYDQHDDEWVALLQGDATLRYQKGQDVRLRKGDWLYIPAHTKHRVERTSIDPPCIWLAVHVTPEGAK